MILGFESADLEVWLGYLCGCVCGWLVVCVVVCVAVCGCMCGCLHGCLWIYVCGCVWVVVCVAVCGCVRPGNSAPVCAVSMSQPVGEDEGAPRTCDVCVCT